ncbi:MAG: hypothetical protein LC634_00830 [Sphingomonadales bacterium]|nr:hypothetical protein [Sphingomonadales bacterium]
MFKLVVFVLTVTMPLSGPVWAQSPAAEESEELDSARLDAARQLMDLMMPPEEYPALIQDILDPTFDNMIAGLDLLLADVPEIAEDDEFNEIISGFLAEQREVAYAMLQESMPGMIDAMIRAHARRFTLPQLTEIRDFMGTETGRTYARETLTMMSDPDVARWQAIYMAQIIAQASVAEQQLILDIQELMEQRDLDPLIDDT